MTQLTFDQWACRNTQAKLDSYIDNELLVETSLELARHFQGCPSCAREAAARRELRGRLKTAARTAVIPARLDAKVRQSLRDATARRTPWGLMAIAATIVLCVVSWLGHERSMLRIAAGDHLHCAVIRQSATRPVGQDKLAPEWKPVLAIAREHVPASLQLAVAHECTHAGRKFVHVTFRGENQLLSVLITRRDAWEWLPENPTARRLHAYEVAGFETAGFLVYTVSDLSKTENTSILAAMAPAIRNALHQGEQSEDAIAAAVSQAHKNRPGGVIGRTAMVALRPCRT